MNPEGLDCWGDHPTEHGCICGNDCAPPEQRGLRGMTDYIPQTSASERIEKAHRALKDYDTLKKYSAFSAKDALPLAVALRALITPPSVGESEEQIASRIGARVAETEGEGFSARYYADLGALHGIRAGIQAAHETWEPADRPSQEQMLRWLGITAEESVRYNDTYFIHAQHIEKEES